MSSNQFDQRILELVNQERAEAGVNPLELDSRLDQAANLHNDAMVQADEMSHQVAGEAGLGDRVTASGYQWNNISENVAAGSTTPEQVMESWMNSPGHRQNILNPNFTSIGVGYEDAPDNRPYNDGNTNGKDYDTYWTQVFGAGDDNDSRPQEQPVDEPEPAPEEQPIDEMETPESNPEEQFEDNDSPEQPVDEMEQPEQPIDEVDNPNSNPDAQPVEESENFDETILDLFNAERAAAGLDLLEIDNQLDQAADLHTNEMVQADRLSNQLPGEASLGDRVSATGYEWRALGQNVAGGFEDPEALVDALMDSPSIRENILNPDYTHLGAGYEEAPDDIAGDADIYWTQVLGTDTSSMG